MSAKLSRFLVLATIAILFLPCTVLASRDMIGLYTDASASECGVDVQPYVPVDIYVIATISSIDGITAAEFSLANYPSAGGFITPQWNSTLTLGSLESSFAIAFSVPLTGSTEVLGTLQLLSFGEPWPGNDYAVSIARGDVYDTPVIVDLESEPIPVLGGRFTFNCTSDANCGCGDGGTADQSVSALKQTY